MSAAAAPSDQDLVDFVYSEARLLDERRYEEWYALFADDGYYWVPLVPDQVDGIDHTSLAYEDKLLLRLRIERLRLGPFSQHPESRGHHLLQRPEMSIGRKVGMGAMRLYLAVAMVLVIIKIAELAIGH